ncbi:hypothetical protein LTR62_000061 [Meristemomyces frigidus]|uniref:Rhodopsin domain-containing protein n=1 Tax=Meristemomyces frigidus TaxID=1508187 RepID=A0AAN7YKZ8_9PEZI|nr:hypothetical protein LTR62_000061 [Meristemomyces frigidus]
MSSKAAPHDAYGGLGPLEMGITWTLAVLATMAVAARVYVSTALLERPGWDLYWAMLAWATALCGQGMQTAAALYGIGNHIEFLTKSDIVQALKWDWLGRMIGVWASFFGKNVVIALILRIQGRTHSKKTVFLHFILLSNLLLTIALVTVLCLRCKPTSMWWNKAQAGSCDRIPSRITEVLGIFQSSWTTASDFALAIYPVFIFWNLSMSWQRKAGICAIMGAGLIAGIVNIFKMVQVQLAYSDKDVTHSLASLLIYTQVEPWLIIICGSLPPIRALVMSVKNKTRASQPGVSSAPKVMSGGSGMKAVEVLEMQGSSEQCSSAGRMRSRSGLLNQKSESQEDILPQYAGEYHGVYAGIATPSLPPGNGIMIRREYEIGFEPRAL